MSDHEKAYPAAHTPAEANRLPSSKYKESILDRSIWVTATPTPLSMALPFYVTEAGHFWADRNYLTRRQQHESFLMLYTVKGCGIVKTAGTEFQLPAQHASVIDCHDPHEYFTAGDNWEFFWIHLNGTAILPLFGALFPDTVHAVATADHNDLPGRFTEILNCSMENNAAGSIRVSSIIHALFDMLFSCMIETGHTGQKKNHMEDVERIVDFIKDHYAEPITVDDMIADIHISKYHFIRIFNRLMGTTPYSYLTNYRITMSKKLLYSTNMPVSEIAEKCGFLDTSNFITQFKKHTGQKPLQYRNDFGA